MHSTPLPQSWHMGQGMTEHEQRALDRNDDEADEAANGEG